MAFKNDFRPFFCRLSILGELLAFIPTLAENLHFMRFR